MSMREKVFATDTGGNSTFTRLKAEVEYNAGKEDFYHVNDSSLTHGDLRKIYDAFANESPDSMAAAPQSGEGKNDGH